MAKIIRREWMSGTSGRAEQVDRLCSLVRGPVVLPALTHATEKGLQYGEDYPA
jgi:hypothetical protein